MASSAFSLCCGDAAATQHRDPLIFYSSGSPNAFLTSTPCKPESPHYLEDYHRQQAAFTPNPFRVMTLDSTPTADRVAAHSHHMADDTPSSNGGERLNFLDSPDATAVDHSSIPVFGSAGVSAAAYSKLRMESEEVNGASLSGSRQASVMQYTASHSVAPEGETRWEVTHEDGLSSSREPEPMMRATFTVCGDVQEVLPTPMVSRFSTDPAADGLQQYQSYFYPTLQSQSDGAGSASTHPLVFAPPPYQTVLFPTGLGQRSSPLPPSATSRSPEDSSPQLSPCSQTASAHCGSRGSATPLFTTSSDMGSLSAEQLGWPEQNISSAATATSTTALPPPPANRTSFHAKLKAAAGSLIAIGGRRVPVDKLHHLLHDAAGAEEDNEKEGEPLQAPSSRRAPGETVRVVRTTATQPPRQRGNRKQAVNAAGEGESRKAGSRRGAAASTATSRNGGSAAGTASTIVSLRFTRGEVMKFEAPHSCEFTPCEVGKSYLARVTAEKSPYHVAYTDVGCCVSVESPEETYLTGRAAAAALGNVCGAITERLDGVASHSKCQADLRHAEATVFHETLQRIEVLQIPIQLESVHITHDGRVCVLHIHHLATSVGQREAASRALKRDVQQFVKYSVFVTAQ